MKQKIGFQESSRQSRRRDVMVGRAGALLIPTGYFTQRYKSSVRNQMCDGPRGGFFRTFSEGYPHSLRRLQTYTQTEQYRGEGEI